MPTKILHKLGTRLAEKKWCVATAESATAGRLCAELALLPESGQILKGGLVCYDAEVKTTVLGISSSFIQEHSPESAEVTAALADSLSRLIPADIHVAITGLTTPGGSETADKPVGTMFFHILIQGRPHAVRQVFSGSPEDITLQALDRVATVLIEALEEA